MQARTISAVSAPALPRRLLTFLLIAAVSACAAPARVVQQPPLDPPPAPRPARPQKVARAKTRHREADRVACARTETLTPTDKNELFEAFTADEAKAVQGAPETAVASLSPCRTARP